ncbi:MAG: thioredoxin family protein [Clostridia bacterium]|nr:thioredoxin family protein [Clostridia bacterium]
MSSIKYRVKTITAVIFAILLVAMTAVSCKKDSDASYKKYIGEISYDASIYAMSMEKIEDEEEPGIVYREVNDFNNVINTADKPILLYFYSSNSIDSAGVTAGVEDIAQKLDGKLLVIGIDIMQHRDIVTRYNIMAVPDFAIVDHAALKSGFNSINYDYWTTTDVYNWIIEQGIS